VKTPDKPIILDASTLLGSGQTVRLAIALASLLGRPVILERIREKREHPGLKEHHAHTVRLIAQISDAHVEGAHPGSRRLLFEPRGNKGGVYGTRISSSAVSVPVLETALLAALFAKRPSTIRIHGGMLFPSVHFLNSVMPLLAQMRVDAIPMVGPDFLGAFIRPARTLRSLDVTHRGQLLEQHTVVIGNSCRAATRPDLLVGLNLFIQRREPMSLTHIYKFDLVTMAFDGIFGKGTERTTHTALQECAEEEVHSGATLDAKTAEQLLPFFAMTSGSGFRVYRVTKHIETAIWLLESLGGARINVRRNHTYTTITIKTAIKQ